MRGASSWLEEGVLLKCSSRMRSFCEPERKPLRVFCPTSSGLSFFAPVFLSSSFYNIFSSASSSGQTVLISSMIPFTTSPFSTPQTSISLVIPVARKVLSP